MKGKFRLPRVTWGHLLCVLAVAAGLSAYVWEAMINYNFALSQTVDDVGRIIGPGQMVTISVATFVLTSMAGWIWRMGGVGNRVIAGILFFTALLPMSYSLSNSTAFNYGQTVGKVLVAQAIDQQARDIADQKAHAQEKARADQQAILLRTYTQAAKEARTRQDKKDAQAFLLQGSRELLSAPEPVIVPTSKDVLPDPKAALAKQTLGVGLEQFRLWDSAILSLICKLFEWLFPTLGFAYWPRGSRGEKVAAPVETPAPETPALPQPVRTVDVSIEEKQALEAKLVGEWLSLCMVHNPAAEDVQMAATDAYGAFVRWCQHVKHRGSVMSQTAFGLRMKEAGVQKRRENGFVYIGLALRKPELVTAPMRKLSAANAA